MGEQFKLRVNKLTSRRIKRISWLASLGLSILILLAGCATNSSTITAPTPTLNGGQGSQNGTPSARGSTEADKIAAPKVLLSVRTYLEALGRHDTFAAFNMLSEEYQTSQYQSDYNTFTQKQQPLMGISKITISNVQVNGNNATCTSIFTVTVRPSTEFYWPAGQNSHLFKLLRKSEKGAWHIDDIQDVQTQ